MELDEMKAELASLKPEVFRKDGGIKGNVSQGKLKRYNELDNLIEVERTRLGINDEQQEIFKGVPSEKSTATQSIFETNDLIANLNNRLDDLDAAFHDLELDFDRLKHDVKQDRQELLDNGTLDGEGEFADDVVVNGTSEMRQLNVGGKVVQVKARIA